jgi:hypothetical protein
MQEEHWRMRRTRKKKKKSRRRRQRKSGGWESLNKLFDMLPLSYQLFSSCPCIMDW